MQKTEERDNEPSATSLLKVKNTILTGKRIEPALPTPSLHIYLFSGMNEKKKLLILRLLTTATLGFQNKEKTAILVYRNNLLFTLFNVQTTSCFSKPI